MSPICARALALGGLLTLPPATALGAQRAADTAITDAGRGPETFVLLSGMVGGVAGFRRLEARLLERGYRVVVIDPYRLSVDSADVTFAALARRVDAVLTARGVTSARVVGHSHGGGVALRLAASDAQRRVTALYFLDVGALAAHRSRVFSASLRLAPVVARIPGGRGFIRARFLRGLRENSVRHDWLDAATQDDYVRPVLDHIRRATAMAMRLARAAEPDSVPALVSRLRVPLTVLLGEVPCPAGPESTELPPLAPLGALLRIERISGVGHFLHEEAPDEVARHLLAPREVANARRMGGAE